MAVGPVGPSIFCCFVGLEVTMTPSTFFMDQGRLKSRPGAHSKFALACVLCGLCCFFDFIGRHNFTICCSFFFFFGVGV